MKKILFIFFFGSLFFYSSAQQKKDSTSAKNKKQHFIGINIGGGAGWREYKSMGDAYALYPPQKGEKPGPARVVGLNYGFTKKHWTHMFGTVYDYAQYQNNNPGQFMGTPWKYTYTHQFLSLSYSFNYDFGKNRNWRVGADFKLGYVTSYVLKADYQDYPKLPGTTKFQRDSVAWAGVFIGRKLFETKKLRLFVDLHANISSVIGHHRQHDDEPPWAPGVVVKDYYPTNPHNLLTCTLQFNLQYKFGQR